MVSTITSETHTTEVWNKLSKIKGLGYKSHISLCNAEDDTVLSDEATIEIIANKFKDISTTKHYDHRFLTTKNTAEEEPITNYEIDQSNLINNIFIIDKLDNALLNSRSTSPGPDDKQRFCIVRRKTTNCDP